MGKGKIISPRSHNKSMAEPEMDLRNPDSNFPFLTTTATIGGWGFALCFHLELVKKTKWNIFQVWNWMQESEYEDPSIKIGIRNSQTSLI